jgi:hypothetical protein
MMILLLLGALAQDGDQKKEKTLPEAAFEALKNNDAASFQAFFPTLEDVIALARLEAAARQEPIEERTLKERCEAFFAELKPRGPESLKKTRARVAARGFDWTKASLKSVTTSKGPFDPASKEPMLDVLLDVESEGKIVTLKVDDCALVNGRRVLMDAFRWQKGP